MSDKPTKPARNKFAVGLGKLGASKGGRARAAKLTPKQRKEIARKAGLASAAKRAAQRKRLKEEKEHDKR